MLNQVFPQLIFHARRSQGLYDRTAISALQDLRAARKVLGLRDVHRHPLGLRHHRAVHQ